jgi:DNA polymerase-1
MSGNFRERQSGERMALNAPIQGSAADIIKKAMIDLDAALDGSGASMLLQVHDELVIEAPEADAKQVSSTVVEIMEGVLHLDVPLVVDVGVGRTLAETKS